MKCVVILAGVVVAVSALAIRFQSIERLDAQRVRLSWESRFGQFYALERSSELPGTFRVVAEAIPATPPLNVVTDTVPAGTSAAYYRVRADSASAQVHWGQHAHDAQRTGYSPAAPPHPWRWAWQWNGSDDRGRVVPGKILLPRNGQPIVAEGRVYVAVGAHGVTALNETNGTVLWQVQPGGAILSTPAYDPGTRALFVVSSNGRLYKLSPVDGSPLGSCILGEASDLPLPPALIPGRLFASMGRHVLALDPATLRTNWLYEAGSPVHTPPAYSATRDLVIVGTADLHVHAIRNRDGTRLWRVKPGPHTPDEHHTFAHGWPVIAEQHGLVLLRQRIHWDYLWLNPDPFAVPDNAVIRARLAAQPRARCHYALRLEDGQIAFHINNGCGGFGNGGYLPMGSMPIVRVFPDGRELALQIIRGDGRYDARWDSHFGEIVLDDHTVPGLQAGDVRWIRHGNTPADDDFLITDEQPFLSAAGNYLFGSHWLVTYAIRPLDRGPHRGSWLNKIDSTNLSWFIVSQGPCGPCGFSPTHYCPVSLNEDPGCGRNYAGGFYVCHGAGAVHDLYWTEYGCVIGLPDKLIVRDTTGAIFCLVSGDPMVPPVRPSAMSDLPETPGAGPISAGAPVGSHVVTHEGPLRYVFNNGKSLLLAFAHPHQGHLKALIPREAWPAFPGLGTAMGRNRAGRYREGQQVRVTGRLVHYQGDPAVILTQPDQCVVLSGAP